MNIAIIAPSLARASETFIRDHIAQIAPGRTVVITEDKDSAEHFAGPLLQNIPSSRKPRWMPGRIVMHTSHFWAAYVEDGLSQRDEAKFITFLREHNVSAVLAEYLPTGALFHIACKKAGARLYVHAHGVDATAYLSDRRWRRRYERVFASAAGVIAPSQYIADRLITAGCPAARMHVSPCGVDATRFVPTARNPGRVLAVGRFVEKKAPQLTIEAFARIASRFPDARLDMIGDGPLMPQCMSLIERLQIGGRVVVHGSQTVQTVMKHMVSAAIFAQHSVTAKSGDMEGMPVAVLEAMASALPVVATRHSGISEAVIEGTTGLLVDEHDVVGMAEGLASLLSDVQLATRMGEAGRQRVLNQYTQIQMCDRLRVAMQINDIIVPA